MACIWAYVADHIIKHIRAKPSALSQHRSQLLAGVLLSTRARGSRNAARVLYVRTTKISCLGAGRGREHENMSSRASHVKYHAS